MSIGQEGDTRQYKRLRRTDYYDAKAANDGLKLDPKHFPRCKICGQDIVGQVYNLGYCMRCFRQ